MKRDSTYYIQFYDDERSPQRKRFSLKTTKKGTAQRLQIKFEDDYLKGEFDPWLDDPWHYDEDEYDALSIGDAADKYLERKKADGRTENTIRTYREVIGLLSENTGTRKTLERVTASTVREFIRDPELAQATQRKRYNQLKTFFRWCQSQQYLRENPIEQLEAPDKPNKLPKAITEEELETLCNQIRERYQKGREKGGVGKNQLIWRIPLFWFAFYTGLRGSEIGRLRWKHVDFRKDLIRILQQKNRKEQTIPLNKKARAILEDLGRDDDEDFVFRSPGFDDTERDAEWFCGNVSRAFRRSRKRAGLREELSFHSLRHGFCTALAEAGKSAVVIKEAARHSDISTSMRYVHMARKRLQEEVEDAFDE